MTAFGVHSESTSLARRRIEAAGWAYQHRNDKPVPKPVPVVVEPRKPGLSPEASLWAFMLMMLQPALNQPANLIMEEVRQKHGLTRIEFMSSRHARELIEARHEAWFRLRNETTLSYPQIGRLFNRDPSTVMHGARRWDRLTKAAASV